MKVFTLFLLFVTTCLMGCNPFHVHPAETIDGLIEQLSSSYWLERVVAAEALGERGPEAKKAVPALIRVLNDKNHDVRNVAARALGAIGDESAKPALIEKLSDYTKFEFPTVAIALMDIGVTKSESPEVVGLLRTALRNSREHKQIVAECLGDLGRDAIEAVPDLILALQKKDSDIHRSVLLALREIGAKRAVPHMAKFLDPQNPCYHEALTGIGRIMDKNPAEVKNWWENEGKFMDWEKQDESPELPEGNSDEKP